MENHHFKVKEIPSKPKHSHENIAQKNKSSGYFWIIFFSLLFLCFLVFSKRDKIEEFFWHSIENSLSESGFSLWQTISLEWIVSENWDFITHTHTITTLSSWIFGLKSKSVNLNQYLWNTVLEWIIDSESKWTYIIEVTKIVSYFPDDNQWTWEILSWDDSLWFYYPKAGIYFKDNFFDSYKIVSTGIDNKFVIQSLDSNESLILDYFVCKAWDANHDCKQLSSTFSQSNEKKFTTQYWTTFYKLSEVTSWFFVNQNFFGYFIHNAKEQDVIAISDLIILPTKEYINENILSNLKNLCKQWNIVMTSIDKTATHFDGKNIVLSASGFWDKGIAQCSLEIDLSLWNLAKIWSFSYQEQDKVVQPDVSQESIPQKLDPNVVQYPISLEKTLIFTSSRGHSITFPSPKISYKSDNISDNLGINWINCYVSTKVIEYVKKDLIDSEPSVIVYECKIKSSIVPPSSYRQINLSDGRTFLVSVINPAWIDFWNNIQVQLNN